MDKQQDKRFIIKKFVMASSLSEAISKEPTVPVEECWIDSDYNEDKKVGF